MLKTRHIFLDNVNENALGNGYKIFNKNADTNMVISATGENVTNCVLKFYGKVANSTEYIQINAFKSSDYNLVSEGTVNQAYIVDCASWNEINVEVSNIVGGNVTVVGEVIE